MAIVVDAARAAGTYGEYNTAAQKGNDHADTPTPSWLTCGAIAAGTAETHVTSRGEEVPWASADNSADAWLPCLTTTFLASTPATVRP